MSSKKMFIVSLLVTVVVGIFCFSGLALADDYGLDKVAESSGLKNGGTDLPGLVGGMLGTALSFIGVLFFALMVFGGFMWMTARGNEEHTKKALNTITAAVIGLVIVLSSYTITSFVFKSAQIADLTEAPASSQTPVSTVAEKDKLCNAAKAGWTCNSKEMCSGNIPDNVTSALACEAAAGKNNCLSKVAGTEDPLCAKAGDVEQFCCQAKPASAVPDSWCFDPKTVKCAKLADVGEANCGSANKVQNKTEKECYQEKVKPESDCSDSGSKGNCATSFTDLICLDKKCVQQPSVEGQNKVCSSSDQCKTGVCKEKKCQYVSSCTDNSKNAGTQTCSARVCGDGHECTDDAQCESKHCVDKKCRSGNLGSYCESDGQCASGFFCTSEGSPSCCLPKLDRNENCFGMNNACKSGTCISKAGFDVCE